ncbi:response regulator [Azoarcus sp. TTM-91]|nr:response regulator [Azoarcus sp. TTM-91]
MPPPRCDNFPEQANTQMDTSSRPALTRSTPSQPASSIRRKFPKAIRLMLIDSQTLFRAGLKALFSQTTDIRVVGEAGDGQTAKRQARAVGADVVLFSPILPDVFGSDLLHELRESRPDFRFLALGESDDSQTVMRSLRAGAHGYVRKCSEPQVLFDAVAKIADGKRYIDPFLLDTLRFDQGEADDAPERILSARERQVLKLLVAGHSISNIAGQLNLSIKTVSTHKSRLLQKTNLSGTADLVRYAFRHHVAD